jgi:hypothetical protein
VYAAKYLVTTNSPNQHRAISRLTLILAQNTGNSSLLKVSCKGCVYQLSFRLLLYGTHLRYKFHSFLGSSIYMFSINHWFYKRRGLALGVVTSGSSFGGVIWPIAVDHLIINVEHLPLELCILLTDIFLRSALVGLFASVASSAWL